MHRQAVAMLMVSVLVLTLPALAQPLRWSGPLTQAQVIARARQSFDARLAELNAWSAAARAQSARAQAFPQISVSETYNGGSPYRLGMPTPAQRFTALEASVPIFAPEAWAAARAAETDASAVRATAAMAVNQAVTGAVQQYDAAALTGAIAQQRAVDVRDEQAHLSFTRQRVRAGAAPRYLVSVAESALAQAQQAEENARADAVRAMHALEVSLDMDMESSPLVALGAPSVTFVPQTTALEHRAYTRRPDILAAERAVVAAQQRLTRARSEYLPMISATAQTYNGVSNPALGRSGSQVGVSASVPLFDGGFRAADVRIAQLAYEEAQIRLERTRLQTQSDVLDAVRDVQAAQRNVVTADAELESAKVALHIENLRERAGKGIDLETIDALATLAGAREDVLRATARYDDSLAALQGAVGDYAPISY